MSKLEQNLELLKQAVLSKRPVLKSVVENSAGQNLLEFVKSYRHNPNQPPEFSKNEVIAEIKTETKIALGAQAAESVARQLNKYFYVSTTDHFGPISHPFFLHANILASLPDQDPGHENFIVLACSNVSMNNSSLPRSLLLHLPDSASGSYERFNLFPAKERELAVFHARRFGHKDLDRIKHQISSNFSKGLYSDKIVQKLAALLEKFLEPLAAGSAEFPEQISKLNFNLWQQIFSQNTVKLNNLIYLQLEKVVINLLIKHHLFAATEINKILFNAEYLEKFERAFNGISGAFDAQSGKGTFLFWYFPDRAKRYSLQRKGADLWAAEIQARIELQPENIKNLLEQGVLVPSNALALAILNCYYKLKCLGGFSQTDYLSEIQTAWNKIFAASASEPTEISTLNFGNVLCGDFSIAFLRAKDGLSQAAILDMLFYNNPDSYRHFIETAKNLNAIEALLPMFPELYKIIYGRRDSELAQISPADIINSSALNSKYVPAFDSKYL